MSPSDGAKAGERERGRLRRLQLKPSEYALTHPIRRGALRILNVADQPVSAADLASQLKTTSDYVHYHLKVLRRYELVHTAPGPLQAGRPEAYFVSDCADDAEVRALLVKHEAEDSVWSRPERVAA